MFVREGEAAGVAADVAMGSLPYVKEAQWRYGVYWQGALYVHCRGEYVSRFKKKTLLISLFMFVFVHGLMQINAVFNYYHFEIL